jgi:two-component system cell cycle sensor histidine kinase/response regulator CckA
MPVRLNRTLDPPPPDRRYDAAAPAKPLRVLLVEDSENDATFVLREIRKGGFQPVYERVWTAPAMKEALQQTWDLVISDFNMPNFSGFGALEVLKQNGVDVPFLLVSGQVGEETAVAAMRAGAQDYIMKRRLARLVPAIERELREAQTRAARNAAENALRDSEEQLRQAQKLEAIGCLAGGVAHDFNNILTAIMGYDDLLLQSLDASDPRRRHAEEVQRSAERAAALTRQLLIFSRKQVLQPRVIDLNVVVVDLEKMLRRLIGEDVTLQTLPTAPQARVKADLGQIEQVIMNLAVNGRDAMPNGGSITIKTAETTFDGSYAGCQPGPYVLLSVADTGTGMSEEVKAHLFEPFFTTKPAGQGTGLGLATSYGIVKQNGGHIEVSSTTGVGTTFSIYLPRVEQAVDSPTDNPKLSGSPSGLETLLIVEDESAVRELSELVLRDLGYNVVAASDGLEALRLRPQAQGVDLLVTDIVMPGLGGNELAERLRSVRPDLKVLFTSGHTEDRTTAARCPEAGTSFLQKPYRPDVLARKVREMLDA